MMSARAASDNGLREHDVITFSDMCVDLILSGPDVTPAFGQVEKLICDYTLELGGSCNLFACQCAKLGLRTAVVGRVGEDVFGRFILQRLEESGVDTRYVTVDPSIKTGLGVALCPPGDRAILTYLGTIDAVTPEDINGAILASTRHIHHGSYFLHKALLPAIPDLFKQAHQRGVTTSLDTNWDPADAWQGLLPALAHTDLFLPNDQEALKIRASLSEQPLDEPDAKEGLGLYQAAAADFLKLGARCVVVKAGRDGAYFYTGDRAIHGSVEPVSSGDSIGAGDAFDAGFLAGWLRNYPAETCLAIGLACGRSVASKAGGLAGQLSWEEANSGSESLLRSK